MKCDVLGFARRRRPAAAELGLKVPLVVRLEGTDNDSVANLEREAVSPISRHRANGRMARRKSCKPFRRQTGKENNRILPPHPAAKTRT
jgi:succinyl-CoA synthetase beta subunit